MKYVVLAKKKLAIYDSIDEMPIVNYQKFNKYCIFDSSIGADIDAINNHASMIAKLIDSDTAKAKIELQNMMQSVAMVVHEISPKYLAFAALIHSIDGEKVTDYSDENLKNIIKLLQTEKHSKLLQIFDSIKKKVSQELKTYFPQVSDNAKEKEYYARLLRRIILQLEEISNSVDNSEKIKNLETEMLLSYKPQSFVGSNSFEIVYDRNFESACTIIGQEAGLDAHIMTVLQYYLTLENINKHSKLKTKAFFKNGR